MDQGRTTNAPAIHIIPHEVVAMHHMTGVRYNEVELVRKFQGHSHWHRMGDEGRQNYIAHIKENGGARRMDVGMDVFGITDYWSGEFSELYRRTMNV